MFVILWCIFMLLTILFLALYCDYRSGIANTEDYKIIKLNWPQVEKFYYIDSSKWHYKTITKKGFYSITTNMKFLVYSPDKNWNNKPYVIKLSFIDSIKLFFFSKYFKNYYNKNMEDFLDSIQKDIDIARKESQNQIEIALKEMENRK